MYRLYFRGPKGFEKHVELDVSSDDEAVRAAQGQFDGRAIEVWNLERLVRTIDAPNNSEQSCA